MIRLGWVLAGLVLVASCGTVQMMPAAEAPAVNGDPVPAAVVATPVALTIPALGVTDDIVPVGLEPNNEMELPPVTQVGWYKLAPKPGEVGRAVIAGHVDWHGTPGAFKHLGTLTSGDTVIVRGADGVKLTFSVYMVQPKLKKIEYKTVTAPLIFKPTSYREIALVTCSGTVKAGEYSDNTVAIARLVSS